MKKFFGVSKVFVKQTIDEVKFYFREKLSFDNPVVYLFCILMLLELYMQLISILIDDYIKFWPNYNTIICGTLSVIVVLLVSMSVVIISFLLYVLCAWVMSVWDIARIEYNDMNKS